MVGFSRSSSAPPGRSADQESDHGQDRPRRERGDGLAGAATAAVAGNSVGDGSGTGAGPLVDGRVSPSYAGRFVVAVQLDFLDKSDFRTSARIPLHPIAPSLSPHRFSLMDERTDRPERLPQVEVELPGDRIGPVVVRLDFGIERSRVHDADGGIARLGHRGEAASAHLGQQRNAEGRPLAGVERVDVATVDVGLDLPPEGIACPAAGDPHLLDRHAHLADQFEAVAHGEGGALEHAADQMRPPVPDGQADPRALGVGVEVGRPLAGHIGEEEQPLGPGTGQRGLVG